MEKVYHFKGSSDQGGNSTSRDILYGSEAPIGVGLVIKGYNKELVYL
ncbi:MAG: hypothetical protein GDA45_03870 [Chromatiales bacterium]|nr:hypothetical protein [Chromatiales bacterium]